MNTNTIVCKFGGTSLASGAAVRKVIAILRSDPNRRYLVVSAPGKRHAGDKKVTDMLRSCNALRRAHKPFDAVLEAVFERYRIILRELDTAFDLEDVFEEIRRSAMRASDAWLESRGEYLMARLMAAAQGWVFVDATEIIAFDKGGFNGQLSYSMVYNRLKDVPYAVIPGYYGLNFSSGEIQLFGRGGSDVTAAGVANGVKAVRYENWTDVSGVFAADPLIVKDPILISAMTGQEAEELCYAGAGVLHPDAITPAIEVGIPVYVRNTFDPDGSYTVISNAVKHAKQTVVGVAGKKGFTVFSASRTSRSINGSVGFVLKLLQILERFGIPFDHEPGRLGSISIVIDDMHLTDGRFEQVRDAFEAAESSIKIKCKRSIALITVVGEGMVQATGSAAAIFAALANAGVNVLIINQDDSEMVILIGVAAADYERATRAIYEACVARASVAIHPGIMYREEIAAE